MPKDDPAALLIEVGGREEELVVPDPAEDLLGRGERGTRVLDDRRLGGERQHGRGVVVEAAPRGLDPECPADAPRLSQAARDPDLLAPREPLERGRERTEPLLERV